VCDDVENQTGTHSGVNDVEKRGLLDIGVGRKEMSPQRRLEPRVESEDVLHGY